jgi:TPR repeat protein
VALLGVAAIASAEPAPPRSPDDQAWTEAARCFGGAWTACAGIRHLAGAADRRGIEARCGAGDPDGCALRGDWAFEHDRDAAAPRGDDAGRWYQRACRGGSAYGCASEAAGLAWTARKARRALYGVACAQGYAPACASLGYELSWNDGEAFPADRARSLAVYRRACALGHARGCHQVLLDLVLDDAALSGARAAAMRDADAGCQRGDADSCGLIDDVLRCGVGFRIDRARAATYRDKHAPRREQRRTGQEIGRMVSSFDCPYD